MTTRASRATPCVRIPRGDRVQSRDRVGSPKLAYILAMGFNEPLDEGAMCLEPLVKDRAVSG
jgi:hypothetical protein